MSNPVPATLYRVAAVAGCGSAAVLLLNAAKRAELIPSSSFTQLIAPVAEILALALVTALYFAFGRRTGTFGLIAYGLNAFALASLIGVEFVINLVFKELPVATVQELRAGPLGVALTVASVAVLDRLPQLRRRHAAKPRDPDGAAGLVRGRRRPRRAASVRAGSGPRSRSRRSGGQDRLAGRLVVSPAPATSRPGPRPPQRRCASTAPS